MNRVSRAASGSYEYYHSDGLGSTRQLSNDSQGVTQTTTYDAFGNVESSTGSSNNVYKYAGQWGYRNDGDDGLMHVGARYYDALVGRFVQADTYLGTIGNPQSLNRYGYVENSPVNMVDPTGHVGQYVLKGGQIGAKVPGPLPIKIIGAVVGGLVGLGVGIYYARAGKAGKKKTRDAGLIEEIVRRLGLSRDEQRRLHDEISKKRLPPEEIWERAEDIVRGRRQ